MMTDWFARFGLDRRFIELTAFMMIGTWMCLIVLTLGMAVFIWPIILIHQAIAWPFSVFGWAAGFRVARELGVGERHSAMTAGWSALVVAEFGIALVINLWSGTGGQLGGLVVLPFLAVLVTTGVLWLYRQATWTKPLTANESDA